MKYYTDIDIIRGEFEYSVDVEINLYKDYAKIVNSKISCYLYDGEEITDFIGPPEREQVPINAWIKLNNYEEERVIEEALNELC